MTYRPTRTGARLRTPSLLAAGLAALLLGVAAGCSERSAPTSAGDIAVAMTKRDQAEAGDLLGHLRAATARYHDIDAAADAGYTIALTGCMEDPTLGGMGYHFGKGSVIANPTPNAVEPEALIYEPQPNGRYRLVGVEYIIPYDLVPRSSTPPMLFGQSFKQNDGFGIWALHAWVWRNNPSGIFEDWNPNVNCDAAPAAARVSHGAH